MKFSCF